MPEVIKISQALAMEDGQQVYALRAKVTAVFKYYDGNNANGHWSFQDCKIKDSTGEMRCSFVDRPEVKRADLIGKTVLFESWNGEKGWSGVKIKEKDYKGEVSMVLWVTKTGQVNVDDQDATEDAQPDPDPGPSRTLPETQPEPDSPSGGFDGAATQPPPASNPAAGITCSKCQTALDRHDLKFCPECGQHNPSPTPAPTDDNGKQLATVRKTRKWLMSRAWGYREALRCADYVTREFEAEQRQKATDAGDEAGLVPRVVEPDQFQAMTSAFFISMDRAGQLDSFPTGAFHD